MKTFALAWLGMVVVAATACTSKDAILTFGGAGHGGSGPSGSAGRGPAASGGVTGAGSGGVTGSGGGTGRACDQQLCIRAVECVRTCGGPVEYTGCCPCESPLMDRVSFCTDASVDAPTGGSGGATTGSGGSAAGGRGGAGGRANGTGGAGGRSATGGATGSGGAPSDGGTDARACELGECLRPYECVRACGGAIEYTGCCPCAAPLFDNFQNMGCGGAGGAGGGGGAGGSSCIQIRNDYSAAVPAAKKCSPTSGHVACDKAVPAVLGCNCTTYVDDDTPLKPYADAWTKAGCALVCVAAACINPQAQICDTSGSSSSMGTCRDAPP